MDVLQNTYNKQNKITDRKKTTLPTFPTQETRQDKTRQDRTKSKKKKKKKKDKK